MLFEWKTADHIPISDVPPGERTGRSANATHGNGISVDTDGNVLLSFRTLNEITKVKVTTGAIMWRLGGLANQFTFVNDAKGAIERQHGLRVAGPGHVQILDNGLVAPSRFVRYLINPVALTALAVMDFRDSPTTLTPVGSAAPSTTATDTAWSLLAGRDGWSRPTRRCELAAQRLGEICHGLEASGSALVDPAGKLPPAKRLLAE